MSILVLGGRALESDDLKGLLIEHTDARHLTITGAGRALVQTAYDTTELPSEVGETLDVVVEDLQSGWVWCRSRHGEGGWVPVGSTSNPDGAGAGAPGCGPRRTTATGASERPVVPDDDLAELGARWVGPPDVGRLIEEADRFVSF
jgi:hypothetical protein